MVSVVIPTYNGQAYIGECLQSVFAQDVPLEVIVVDDMSTDNTATIAEEMGARVIVNNCHRGQVAGKNTGIMNMRGDCFVTIDQDDRFKPDALANLLDEMRGRNAQIVMAKLEDFGQSVEDKEFCHKEPYWGILTGAAIFQKDVFNTIGLFDESVATGDVLDLADRCRKKGITIFKSDIVTCERRIHAANFGRVRQREEYRDYAKFLRKQFLERNGLLDEKTNQ